MGNTQPDFVREEEGVVSLMERELKLKAYSARMCSEDSECTQASPDQRCGLSSEVWALVMRVVYGRPKVVYGWPVVVCGWPNRCHVRGYIRSAITFAVLGKVVLMLHVVERQVAMS